MPTTPTPPERKTKKVKDVRPGDVVVATSVVERIELTATQVVIHLSDGRTETYELSGDPAIEVW
jgi:hypothetical protein